MLRFWVNFQLIFIFTRLVKSLKIQVLVQKFDLFQNFQRNLD